MVNRERFMLDVDSEGFPLVNTSMASYTLRDEKCDKCANPTGWVEVDGVVLPVILWGEPA